MADDMSLYFFDVRNNGTLIYDDVGVESVDLKTAAREAALILAEQTEEMIEGSLRQELEIDIRDISGVCVLKITLAVGPTDILH